MYNDRKRKDLRIKLQRVTTGDWKVKDMTGQTSPITLDRMLNPNNSDDDRQSSKNSVRSNTSDRKIMEIELQCIRQQQNVADKQLEILQNKTKMLELEKNIAIAQAIEEDDDDDYDTAEEDNESFDANDSSPVTNWVNSHQIDRQNQIISGDYSDKNCVRSSTPIEKISPKNVSHFEHLPISHDDVAKQQQHDEKGNIVIRKPKIADNLTSADDLTNKTFERDQHHPIGKLHPVIDPVISRQPGHTPTINSYYRGQQTNDANLYEFDGQSNRNHNNIKLVEKFIARQAINRDLPIFSGEPLKWPQFIAEFTNSTRDCKFSNSENQDRLKKCLRGKAREIVDHLLILPETLNEILTILKNRFGRSEFVIHHLLDKLTNWPVVKEGKPDSLTDFCDFLTSLVSTLKVLKEDDHLRNPILFRDVLNKIPVTQSVAFIEYFDNLDQETPKLKILEFLKWIEKKANAASQLVVPPTISNVDSDKSKSKGAMKKDVTYTIVNKGNHKTCNCCKTSIHSLSDCAKFIKLDINDKWDFITKNPHCFSCLNPSHMLKFCRQRKSCGIDNCNRPHHQLLHKPVNSKPHNVNETHQRTDSNCFVNNSCRKVLLKIVPVKLKGPKMTIETHALLDDASTVSLIDEDTANSLGLDGPIQPLKIQWTNNQLKQQDDSKTVSVTISGDYDQAKSYTLRHVKTIKGLSLPTQTIEYNQITKHFKYSPNIKDLSYNNGKPVILIGQDNWPVLVNRKIIYGPWNGPALSKTLLGWVAHGNLDAPDNNSNFTCHVFHSDNSPREKDDIDVLQDLVKEQWKYELCGTKSENELGMFQEDKRCVDILKNTIKRVDDDRFECGLLWKDDNTILPESKTAALARLQCLERKMDNNSEYAKLYSEKIHEYIDKGYLKKISPDNIDEPNTSSWYLPHFGVVNPNKPNKLRIVFDAASKSNGRCLNDFLLSGPDLYNSLPNILINFRNHPIAFVADIKEMFLQVNVRVEDRPAQRLLWRGMDRNRKPDVYEIQVVFFGSTCGPCLAQEVKNQNARECMQQYPETCNDIINNHYMDDYLGGADSEDKAIQLIQDVIAVHKKGHFVICNWISNSSAVLDSIDNDLRANLDFQLHFDDDKQKERILGMWWDFKNDTFVYPLKFNKLDPAIINLERRPTKRDVLKIIMSVFDPLGFLSNILIGGKILMQKIWESDINWDDEINDHQFDLWAKWFASLHKVKHLQIPRRYTTLPIKDSQIELHIFCDASQDAYAAVAFLRFKHGDEIQCILVNAKSRVAPLKPMSIPRLELQAALLGARLANSSKSSLNFNVDTTYLWSDSENVLRWIKSYAKRFKVFVAQRVGEIQELTNATDWHYVPTILNVADDATKIKHHHDFDNNHRWFKGPPFLYEPLSTWPKQDKIQQTAPDLEIEELKTDYVNLATANIAEIPIPNLSKFSKYWGILRSTTWMLLFIDRCVTKRSAKGQKYTLQPDDIAKAEKVLFRKIQTDSYSSELHLLSAGKPISKSSKLGNLTCIVDSDGIIRINGRLSNANINDDTKNPIVLDGSHPITRRLIEYYHAKNNHMGTDTVICNIRMKYWIPRLRNTLKKISRDCQHCKNKRAKPEIPVMSQLPLCRVEPTARPFIKCGVDYFGPLEVTVGRSHEKRYGVIFTCMVTRAVHLEIAHNLSSNAFMFVFRQFGSRRGFPEEMYSDNGTNFRKADKDITNAIASWDHDKLMQVFTMKNCKWHFNPPLAPHMGGAWERLIRTTKQHLFEMLKEKYPHEYVLRTLLYEVENILNSRPLTNVPLDSEDADPLTPNHFLIGPSYANLRFTQTTDRDLTLLNRWKATQQLLEQFWKRWVKEYLTHVIISNKWTTERPNIAIGDFVIIMDPENPRNSWPKGIVSQVYPAKDGRVRVVDIRTKTGVYKRAVAKLVKLDIHKNGNSSTDQNELQEGGCY